MNWIRTALGCVALAGSLPAAAAQDQIVNYREYSPGFASAGQPTEKQLEALRERGFERVVYIAFSDHENALDNEDRLVKSLGMAYLHIPVDWEAPAAGDFYQFAGAMQATPKKQTLLHCQVNFRASAFAFLYRVLYEDVPVAEAKQAMNSVWTPNETWRQLIFDILEENGHSPHCEGCDWGTAED